MNLLGAAYLIQQHKQGRIKLDQKTYLMAMALVEKAKRQLESNRS